MNYAMVSSACDSFSLAADKAGRLQKLRHVIGKSMTLVIASVMEDKLPSYNEPHEERSQSSTGVLYIRIIFVDHVAYTQFASQALFHPLLGHRHVSFQKHLIFLAMSCNMQA